MCHLLLCLTSHTVRLAGCWLLQAEQFVNLDDSAGMLMESWPDDAEHGTLAAALRALLPARPTESWADGEILVTRGEACNGVFRVEEGWVELEGLEEVQSDDEDEEEACLCIKHLF